MRRIVAAIIIMVTVVCSLNARPEIWTGMGFAFGRDYTTDGFRNELKVNDQLVANGLYNSGDVAYMTLAGPYYEAVLFPYPAIKVGIYAGGRTSFIIGYDGSGYNSRYGDLSQNVRVGVAYNQLFSATTGIYTDLAFDYAWYSISGSNKKNNKQKPEYTHYQQMGIYADLGCLVQRNSSFFKCGFSFLKPILNDFNNGWSIDIGISGGFIF